MTVHLGLVASAFHCLLNGDLFLPEGGHVGRARCREAGIPNEMVYRPKVRIALELVDRAQANGLVLEWLTLDEWYGSKPSLGALDDRRQRFIGEISKDVVGWIDPPRITSRPYRRGRHGRSRKAPRLLARSCPARTVAP